MGVRRLSVSACVELGGLRGQAGIGNISGTVGEALNAGPSGAGIPEECR